MDIIVPASYPASVIRLQLPVSHCIIPISVGYNRSKETQMGNKPKTQNVKKPRGKPLVGSPSEYAHKVETVAVRYRNGVPIQIVHPEHLTCLQHTPPQPVQKGGRPALDRIVRYVLNRALFDYLFIPRNRRPQPLTRYGVVKLALKWCDQERNRILSLKQSSVERKKQIEKAANDFIISRDTFEKFLKPFFKKPRQRLSPNALRKIFPHLWY